MNVTCIAVTSLFNNNPALIPFGPQLVCVRLNAISTFQGYNLLLSEPMFHAFDFVILRLHPKVQQHKYKTTNKK